MPVGRSRGLQRGAYRLRRGKERAGHTHRLRPLPGLILGEEPGQGSADGWILGEVGPADCGARCTGPAGHRSEQLTEGRRCTFRHRALADLDGLADVLGHGVADRRLPVVLGDQPFGAGAVPGGHTGGSSRWPSVPR